MVAAEKKLMKTTSELGIQLNRALFDLTNLMEEGLAEVAGTSLRQLPVRVVVTVTNTKLCLGSYVVPMPMVKYACPVTGSEHDFPGGERAYLICVNEYLLEVAKTVSRRSSAASLGGRPAESTWKPGIGDKVSPDLLVDVGFPLLGRADVFLFSGDTRPPVHDQKAILERAMPIIPTPTDLPDYYGSANINALLGTVGFPGSKSGRLLGDIAARAEIDIHR